MLEKKVKPAPKRKLAPEERDTVLNIMHQDRFVDKAPAQIYAALLDEDVYVCSVSTMYRILHENDEVKERRKIARQNNYSAPELLATGPNQVWSYDITKLKGPEKWSYCYLYVIMDIYSRYVVGWMVAMRESASLAETLIEETCMREEVDTTKLVIHSDRGAPMTSKIVAHLLADLGVTKSLSRPRVCNDNPFSESHFKTLKHQPTFPERFGGIEDARSFCVQFFDWYNNCHYHSNLALMTPFSVHHGLAEKRNEERQVILSKAYAEHPERFVSRPPTVMPLQRAVWINPPKPSKMLIPLVVS